MAQDLSIEYPDNAVLVTTRTMGSRLWFLHNRRLQRKILGYLAKYQERYGVVLYAFIIMGNHYHLLAKFPRGNRAAFLQSFNSIFARLVQKHVPTFDQGKLWARRARIQLLPNDEDIQQYFLYLINNPISSGLCRNHGDYDGYNSLADSLRSNPRNFQVIDWADYQNRKRFNAELRPSDCTKSYALRYSPLPSLQHLSFTEYRSRILALVREHKCRLIQKRIDEGKSFASKSTLQRTAAGATPVHSKRSHRHTPRPLVLTLCAQTRRNFLEWYFGLVVKYRAASKRYRTGEFHVEFPPRTYRPIVPAFG